MVFIRTMASGVTPVTMEFLDELSIKAVEKNFNMQIAPNGTKALIITDIDGNLEEDIEWQLRETEKIFKESGAEEFIIAKDEEERQKIWFARRTAGQSMSIYGKRELTEDITVPRKELSKLLEEIDKISKKYDLLVPCFGHVGDGNVHVSIIVDESKNVEEEIKKAYSAIKDIFAITIELGGTLSGEHGIGVSKAPYMSMAFSDEEMNLFRAIKKAFDPNNILNPDKMGI